MSLVYAICPIFAIVAVFIAYRCGYRAGKEKTELEHKLKEQEQSNYADKIISDNFGLDADSLDTWLSERAKK